jgi:hypothetical protein
VVTDDDPELELCEEPLDEEPLPDEPVDDEPLPEEPLDVEPVVEESSEELFVEESSEEELFVEESSVDDPVVEVVSVVEVPVVDDPFDAFVVVAAELAPRLPVAAITPNASAKVARAAALMRRRIILMRRARSRSRLRTSGFEAGGGVAGMPAS